MTKKLGLISVIVVVLLAVGVGLVAAQDTTPPAETPSASDETCQCQCENICVQGRGPRDVGRGMGMGRDGATPTLLAETLGMTVTELSTALDAGQTITQLAEAQGLTVAEVVDAVVAPRVERINQAVENGNLTREQADEQIATMKEHMLQRLTDRFTFGSGMHGQGNGDRPMGGGMRGGGMRGRGGNGYQTPVQPEATPES